MEIKLLINSEEFFEDKKSRESKSTVVCECGNRNLLVNWIPSPFTGGFLKLTCPNCDTNKIVLDDFA
jgi:hypothetical protein